MKATNPRVWTIASVMAVGLVCCLNVTFSQPPRGKHGRIDAAGSVEVAAQTQQLRDRAGRRRQGRRGNQVADSKHGPEHIAQTEVPPHAVDVILGRPTRNSVTISVLAYSDMSGQVVYGTEKGQFTGQSASTQFTRGEPAELVIRSLQPDTRYCYELRYQAAGSSGTVEGTFHTQRPSGSEFVFTVQADSHLDQNTAPEIYANTLTNVLADGSDFHIDLGDTFMTGKYRGEDPTELYLAQRFYFGLACRSASLFLVLGNHDGEPGGRGRTRAGAVLLRKTLFPNPYPDDFYTGNVDEEEGVGLLHDYYAWEWGDALFVVLDPYWYSARQRGGVNDNWSRTLGLDQYRWLQSTLAASRAAFKFLFIHNLVGGADSSGRGGVEVARNFEWGGHNLDGRSEFKEKRPGWSMPIHRLLVENNVSVVFHGHDHFFAKQELDGVIYQLVPQPGHSRYGGVRTAREYGYVSGEFLAGSGHMRATISPDKVIFDFVLSVLPNDESRTRTNRAVAHSYLIRASPISSRED